MRGIPLSTLDCSIARTLEVVGDRWTLLVLRDAFLGIRRFEDFAASLPIARNVLTDRLRKLVDHGVLRGERYQERPERFEYRLTEKGHGLYPVLIAMLTWGDRYLAGAKGPPLDVIHRDCGGHVVGRAMCQECGRPVTAQEVAAASTRPGQ